MTRKRLRFFKERRASKRRRQEEQGLNWSNLPYDILEGINRHLRLVDRTRIQAVCKGWSNPDRDIVAAAIRELPWAMKICLSPNTYNDSIKDNVWCRMVDPLTKFKSFIRVKLVSDEDALLFLDARPCASKHGWVLFKVLDFYELKITSLFLYSPFTAEVIKLPDLGDAPTYQVATFSLDATSPRCFVFLLWAGRRKIHIKLCRVGDKSWNSFEFDGFDGCNPALDATYANGVFYVVFKQGHLGAFDPQLGQWSVVVDQPSFGCCPYEAKLIAFESDLRLLIPYEPLQLLKLDFPNTCWVDQDNLNGHVLFTGSTSCSAQAVGEARQFANTVFSSSCSLHPSVRFYGASQRRWLRCVHYVEATEDKTSWIELPWGVTWSANDLIHAS